LHPTGIFIVVCFKEAFKIYNLTYEGIANTYRGDSINDIQGCAICPQGNQLAVASNSMIFIYDFYSCRRIKIFTLPLGVNIESMSFQSHFLSCHLKNKKLYVYDTMKEYKEIMAFNPRMHLN
jgi:WD40 repeat protein